MLRLKHVAIGLLVVGSLVWVVGAQAPAGDETPLPADQQATLLERHPEADANGDGTVTRAEAREFFRQQQRDADRPPRDDRPGDRRGDRMRPPRLDPVELLEQHPEWDTDGDGVLSDNELQAARISMGRPDIEPFRPYPRFFDWLLERFDEADLDKNGELSKEEITKLRDQYASSPTTRPTDSQADMGARQLLSRFPEADADGDGQVTPEEFRAYRERNPGNFRQTLLDRYPDADTDGDGTLSDDEFNALRQRIRSRVEQRPGGQPEPRGRQQRRR